MTDLQIKTAVVTGQHPFDVPSFTRLFRVLPNVDGFIQTLDDFAADDGKVRDWYDVVLFYNFHQVAPGEGGGEPPLDPAVKATLERLGQTEQGVVVLHHGLLAFRNWPFWSDLVGIPNRGFGYYHDQEINITVADAEHPITRGVRDWTMVDETYTLDEPIDDVHILLTTDHPQSMHALAWTHAFGKARVFCCELGHDAQAFDHPRFRTVLGRGIAWAAKQL